MTTHEDIACREIVELVTDYLEDALPPDRRAAFEAHLENCTGCRNYLAQMRETLRLTGELTAESLPPEVQDELCRVFVDLNRPGS